MSMKKLHVLVISSLILPYQKLIVALKFCSSYYESKVDFLMK